MHQKNYDRTKVVEYAKKWAYLRNPSYYNFDPIGGDCTNFASQCIYAGSNVMNYEKEIGWYYNNINDRSPSWTGVTYLYTFLMNNKKVGPFGRKVKKEELEIGDLIQLAFTKENFTHSLIVVGKEQEEIYVATHTYDSFYRKLSSYTYETMRGIHIEGVRIW